MRLKKCRNHQEERPVIKKILCLACKGTRKSSRGNQCFPCNGSGKGMPKNGDTISAIGRYLTVDKIKPGIGEKAYAITNELGKSQKVSRSAIEGIVLSDENE